MKASRANTAKAVGTFPRWPGSVSAYIDGDCRQIATRPFEIHQGQHAGPSSTSPFRASSLSAPRR